MSVNDSSSTASHPHHYYDGAAAYPPTYVIAPHVVPSDGHAPPPHSVLPTQPRPPSLTPPHSIAYGADGSSHASNEALLMPPGPLPPLGVLSHSPPNSIQGPSPPLIADSYLAPVMAQRPSPPISANSYSAPAMAIGHSPPHSTNSCPAPAMDIGHSPTHSTIYPPPAMAIGHSPSQSTNSFPPPAMAIGYSLPHSSIYPASDMVICHSPPHSTNSYPPPAMAISHSPPQSTYSYSAPAMAIGHSPPHSTNSYPPPAMAIGHSPPHSTNSYPATAMAIGRSPPAQVMSYGHSLPAGAPPVTFYSMPPLASAHVTPSAAPGLVMNPGGLGIPSGHLNFNGPQTHAANSALPAQAAPSGGSAAAAEPFCGVNGLSTFVANPNLYGANPNLYGANPNIYGANPNLNANSLASNAPYGANSPPTGTTYISFSNGSPPHGLETARYPDELPDSPSDSKPKRYKAKSSRSPKSRKEVYLPSYMKGDETCLVCDDFATGNHYSALSCEGCKGFFRRANQKKSRYVCKLTKNCTISKSNRNNCQFCRLERCLRAGMKPDSVLDDNRRRQQREVIAANRERKKAEREAEEARKNMVKLEELELFIQCRDEDAFSRPHPTPSAATPTYHMSFPGVSNMSLGAPRPPLAQAPYAGTHFIGAPESSSVSSLCASIGTALVIAGAASSSTSSAGIATVLKDVYQKCRPIMKGLPMAGTSFSIAAFQLTDQLCTTAGDALRLMDELPIAHNVTRADKRLLARRAALEMTSYQAMAHGYYDALNNIVTLTSGILLVGPELDMKAGAGVEVAALRLKPVVKLAQEFYEFSVSLRLNPEVVAPFIVTMLIANPDRRGLENPSAVMSLNLRAERLLVDFSGQFLQISATLRKIVKEFDFYSDFLDHLDGKTPVPLTTIDTIAKTIFTTSATTNSITTQTVTTPSISVDPPRLSTNQASLSGANQAMSFGSASQPDATACNITSSHATLSNVAPYANPRPYANQVPSGQSVNSNFLSTSFLGSLPPPPPPFPLPPCSAFSSLCISSPTKQSTKQSDKQSTIKTKQNDSTSGFGISGLPTSALPTSAYPTSGLPTPAYPTSGLPTPAYPTSGLPTPAYPTSGLPTPAYPTSGLPTPAYPTSGLPTPAYPTSGFFSRFNLSAPISASSFFSQIAPPTMSSAPQFAPPTMSSAPRIAPSKVNPQIPPLAFATDLQIAPPTISNAPQIAPSTTLNAPHTSSHQLHLGFSSMEPDSTCSSSRSLPEK